MFSDGLFDSRDITIEFRYKHESGCVLFCSFIIQVFCSLVEFYVLYLL